MWRWWLQYGSQIVGSSISASTIMHFVLQLHLFIDTEFFWVPFLHSACCFSEWLLPTVHLNSSKVSKVLFFSICSRWLELAGRSSRDPCQILMSSGLAFAAVSPLLPGWLLSSSITFSLRQQEIVSTYSWYPLWEAVHSPVLRFQLLQRKACWSCLSCCLLPPALTAHFCAPCLLSPTTAG